MAASAPDAELLRRARQGDSDAFIKLTEPLRPHVYGVLAGMTGREDAEDLAQEVFVRAFRALPRFRGDASLRTWITRIAVNLAFRHTKRRRENVPLDDLLESAWPSVEAPDTAMRLAVRDAVQQLTPKLRAAVVLFYFEGLELNEVAAALRINRGTVASRLHEARRILRGVLDPNGEEEFAR
jgi:RNA polymerase sigma-70 factor, ECF subfamily